MSDSEVTTTLEQASHTASPWHVDGDEIIAGDGDLPICQMPLFDGVSPTEWQANMRLVSAAPDMLAALRGLIAPDGSCVFATPKAIAAGRAAIEKATVFAKATAGREDA